MSLRILASPVVAALVTFGVRICLYFLLLNHSSLTSFLSVNVDRPVAVAASGNQTTATAAVAAHYYSHGTHEEMFAPPHLHFSIWNPATAPATWKDTLYWRDQIGAAHTPAYLSSVMAWYTPYLPRALAHRPVSGVWLALCDALTALLVATWPSCRVGILYGFFILNPVCIIATVFESLVGVEIMLLCVAVNAAHTRGSGRVLTLVAGVAACVLLGSEFMAVAVALLYPLGISTMSGRVMATGVAVVIVGAMAALHIYLKRNDAHDAAFYIPPDNSPMWYVRESILAVFARSFEVMYLQLPTITSVLLLTYLPPFSRPKASQCAHGAFQPLFPSARVAASVFALLLSLLFRGTATLPYWCVGILFLYASLNPRACKPVQQKGGEVVVRSVWMRTRVLVPIYTAAMAVPLEITFYGGWALRETSNPNWIFFAQIGYAAAGVMFVCVWFNELVADLLEMEWLQKKLLSSAAAAAASPQVAHTPSVRA